MGRILALDIGTVRTGIAVSDPEQAWAFGRGVVTGGPAEVVAAVSAIIRDEDVGLIVVGLPIPLQGDRSTEQQAIIVRAFADELRKSLTVPIEFEEERFTTQLGARLEHEAGRTNGADERAAVLILESYLARMRNRV